MNSKLPGLCSTLLAISLLASCASAHAADSFSITLDPAIHGKYQVTPALPTNARVPANTILTLTAQPDAGYVLDSLYDSVTREWGPLFFECMTSPCKVHVDRDLHVGASFIDQSAVAHIDVRQDIVYAKPGVKPLKYDVFTPKGAKNLPIIVIIHGGGWMNGDENITRGLARELTRGGKFVVASIDYRWAGKADGDATSNTMADIIGDVYGAIAHIMEHAREYGGDPTRIGLTGDSAGGHLAAAASLMVEQIGERGFGRTPGVFEFKPSYLPKGKSVAAVKKDMLTAIKAAAPSYGVFNTPDLHHFSDDPKANDSWTAAIAPQAHIPMASVRAVPQFLTRGSEDPVISDTMCAYFMDALVRAGQRVEYIQVGGAQHAFFDWKPDAVTKATFKQYGVYYAAAMKAFFESVMYP